MLLVAISIAAPVCVAEPQGHARDNGPILGHEPRGDFNQNPLGEHNHNQLDPNKKPLGDQNDDQWKDQKNDHEWKDEKNDHEWKDQKNDLHKYNPWWSKNNIGGKLPWQQSWWEQPHNHVWGR